MFHKPAQFPDPDLVVGGKGVQGVNAISHEAYNYNSDYIAGFASQHSKSIKFWCRECDMHYNPPQFSMHQLARCKNCGKLFHHKTWIEDKSKQKPLYMAVDHVTVHDESMFEELPDDTETCYTRHIKWCKPIAPDAPKLKTKMIGKKFLENN